MYYRLINAVTFYGVLSLKQVRIYKDFADDQ